jgi:hypothetical protein
MASSYLSGAESPALSWTAEVFHTAGRRAYLELREAYSRFVAAFRDAAEKLRAGDRLVAFPEGSFPPALPFVRLAPVG